MAAEPTQGHSRILRDRKWEDYRSLKQYYRNHNIEEFIVSCYDTSTSTAIEMQPDPTLAITYLSAKAQVYVANQTDVQAQDGAPVYVTYVSSTGVVYDTITLLNIAGGAGGTATPMPLGNENILDVVDGAPDGAEVTLTTLTATENEWAGKYLVCYSGNEAGKNSIILSNTADEGGVVVTTLKDDWAAGMDADLVSIQTYPYDDFYRVRAMSFGVEGGDADNTWVCNITPNAYYGIISDGNTQAVVPRYFVPAKTTGQDTRYYLGYIKVSVQRNFEVADDPLGHKLTVTYTPKALNANIPAADVTIEITFTDYLNLEPCIELEPATDVLVKIHKILNANHNTVYLEYCFLEVDRLTN